MVHVKLGKKCFFIVVMLASHLSSACPTCFGAAEERGPAFFSDDAYTPYKGQGYTLNEGEKDEELVDDDHTAPE